MSDLTILGLCIAGVCAVVGLFAHWCRPVRFVQLGRFPGNEVAIERYEIRRDALGHGAIRERSRP